MIGLQRLDDLQRCVETLLADDVPGNLIEAGVWRGGAAILMCATLLAHGADQRGVWVADSFRGLPAPKPDVYPVDGGSPTDFQSLSYLAVPVEEVRANFERYGVLDDRVHFLEGWFSETLPTLRERRWSLMRLDGDMYESTWVALDSLYPGLSVGGFVIIDDYGHVEECREAVEDFRREHRIDDPLIDIDGHAVRWRRSV